MQRLGTPRSDGATHNAAKVSIAVGGRFAAFDMASALQRRGRLGQLLTSYLRAHTERVLWRRLTWSPWLDVVRRLRLRLGDREVAEVRFHQAFDRWASRNLRPCSVLQAWSGFCVDLLGRARSSGITTVLLRGSVHILEQARLLAREHQRLGMEWTGVPAEIIDRELAGYERADYIQVLSSFAFRSFCERGVAPGRLFLLPLGVDLDRFSSDEAFVPPLARHDPPVLLFVGHLSVRKGVATLLDAFRGLDAKAELHLIGGRSAESPSLGRLPPGVLLHGHMSPRRLRRWYRRAAVVVVPSVEDGGPAVISEAMAAGTPVVATENTAGRDLVMPPRHGLVVSTGEVDALRTAILRLLSDGDLAERMGREAREWVLRYGSWGAFGSTMLEAYAAMRTGSYSARFNQRLLATAGFRSPAP